MFSIVMPVWNKRHFIQATLDSVFGQSWQRFELIAVDDGSTDGSADLLRGLADPRIRLVEQPRAGAGAARNAGMAVARSEWIAFLDADDLWHADHLVELDRVRRAHPDAGLIATAFLPWRGTGEQPSAAGRPGPIRKIEYFGSAACVDDLLVTSSVAIQAEIYRTMGGFSLAASGQDKEYWARIALSRPVAVSRRATVIYRHGSGGITDTNPRLFAGGKLMSLRETYPVIAFLLDRYDDPHPPDLRRGIDRYIARHVQWALRQAALAGDRQALRNLPRLWPRRLTAADHALLVIARLPRFARAPLIGLAARLSRWARRLRRR